MEQELKSRLRCPCGELLHAQTESELVDMARRHLKSDHPQLAGRYSDEQILSMAH